MATATSVCTSRAAPLSPGCAASRGSTTTRSPKITNSRSEWRARATSAPGMTTAAPWSPPMASSAMRTLSGMKRQYPVFTFHNRGLVRLAAGPLLERLERCEGPALVTARRRLLEDGACLTWIRVDRKHQEFGRKGPEIDRAADERLRRVARGDLDSAAFLLDENRCWRRREHEIDVVLDLVLHRLERDHTGLPDGRRDPAADAQPVTAVPGDLERGFEPRQRLQPRKSGDGGARLAVGG